MTTLIFSSVLLSQMKGDISLFIGTTIDISSVPNSFSTHLNADVAKEFNVTQGELSTQMVEDIIRALAVKANVKVVCFSKDDINLQNIADTLKQTHLLLLK